MKIEEFETEKKWWGNEESAYKQRTEGEYSWKVNISDIKARNYNLDIKNPHVKELEAQDPLVLLDQYRAMQKNIADIREALKYELEQALQRGQ